MKRYKIFAGNVYYVERQLNEMHGDFDILFYEMKDNMLVHCVIRYIE